MAGLSGALCIVAIACASLARADDFLARVSPEEVQQQFHMELQSMLGQGNAASVARLTRLQSELEPLYSAMPKSAGGGLDQAAARYALHRFFAQQHGWHVRGLEATGDEKSSGAASTTMLEDHIPGYVLQLFEQYRGGQTGLRELAVLAATLEDVVHSEAIQLLSTAFATQSTSVAERLHGDEEHRIITTYLLFHLLPNDHYAELSTAGFNRILDRAPTFWSGWLDTVMWAQDLRDTMDYDESSLQNPFVGKLDTEHDFNSLVRLVEGIGEKYAPFQDLECRGMKDTLLDLSDGSGRVRLAKFYEEAVVKEGASHFSESPDYLRHMGALDETDPRQPSVIVTNYMYARANCLASSSLYSICCMDECDPLMAKLERSIASPVADPQKVAELVAAMPSDTVSAPRNLSMPMRRRLDDIAGRHEGKIPLHGRLFAQWMHHAFPNECSYPHLTGSLASPLSIFEVLHAENETGLRLKASQQEMESFLEAAAILNATDPQLAAQAPLLPWTEEEELWVGMPVAQPMGMGKSLLRLAPLALAICSAVIGLVRMLGAALPSTSPANAGKERSWMLGRTKGPEQQWV